MIPPRLPFFLYGTLLPGERNHRLLLREHSLSWTPAVLHAALLFQGPGHPYAVPDPTGAGTVRGAVAVLDGPGAAAYEQVLTALDRLEGYVPGSAANHYERARRIVLTESGEVDAWVYFAADRTARELLLSGSRIDSGDWLDRAEP